MTRLVIDARLAGHSGIGVYLDQMLPRVVPPLGSWRPVVLARAATRGDWASRLGRAADIFEWDVPPLGVRNLASAPPGLAQGDLLWTPHFNVPLVGSAPLAVTLHDLLPLTAPRLAGRGRSFAVHRWLTAIRARARVVFCVSEFTRGEAIARGALDPARLVVTPLGVDRQWFAPAPAAMGHADTDLVAQPTIIFVGLLKPHKNVARLLHAFNNVKTVIPHRLVLVARHEGLRNIDREALSVLRTLGDRIELVSDLARADLIARVQSAQFAVLPSLHEGFGLPALEAMAAATPVLAGRAGALPEVCGDAATYCDPWSVDDIARGLLLLASDPSLRARLATAGRERATAYTWDRCAAATAGALDAALTALRTASAR